jgi:hypothetical protein
MSVANRVLAGLEGELRLGTVSKREAERAQRAQRSQGDGAEEVQSGWWASRT